MWWIALVAATQITVTIEPLRMILQELVPEAWVEVHVLVPPGLNPHVYSPRPSDVALLERSRLFVRIGGRLDPWAKKLAQFLPPEGAELTILPEGDTADPHLWLDPEGAQVLADSLTRALVRLFPDRAETLQAARDRFLKAVDSLWAWASEQAASARGKSVILTHRAWARAVRHLGLKVAAVIFPTPGVQLSPREMARLIRLAREERVVAVFAERGLNDQVPKTLAAEAGIRLVYLDPLRHPEKPEGASYLAFLRWNLRQILEGVR